VKAVRIPEGIRMTMEERKGFVKQMSFKSGVRLIEEWSDRW